VFFNLNIISQNRSGNKGGNRFGGVFFLDYPGMLSSTSKTSSGLLVCMISWRYLEAFGIPEIYSARCFRISRRPMRSP